MLRISELNSFYGDSHIIHDIELSVNDGARVALLGRNGAGKSTLLKSIMNAGPRAQGLVEWEGNDLGDMPSFRRSRLGISLVPENRCIIPHLSVLENLQMAYRGLPKENRPEDPVKVLNSFPMLIPLEKRLGGRLSGGQQQLLAFARAVVARPKLLLLDEPTEGLAPTIVEQLARDVADTCSRTKTGLLLCEQNLWFARKCTDYVYVIDSGSIVFHGDWATFDQNPTVRTQYLAV